MPNRPLRHAAYPRSQEQFPLRSTRRSPGPPTRADHTASYTVLSVDDWIARVKPRGHALLEETQVKFDAERFDRIAHLWSTYVFHIDGKQVARGINSIQAIKAGEGWRVLEIMWQAESPAAPLPKEFLP